MAKKSNNTALAVALQVTAGTFVVPTQPADLMPVSNLRPSIEGVTIANDEYTGSVVKNGNVVAGKRASMSFNIKLRPPGGGAVPAANAFLPGRILQGAKFTELRTPAAIPVAAEALAAGGTTTTATLGAGAAATADLYKGMAVQLLALGATLKAQLTAIRSYSAAKVAALVETLTGAAAGNYQIPVQLGYMRSISSTDPVLLCFQTWIGGDRWDWVDCRVTGLRIVVPVSTRDQAAYPEIEVTIEGTIYATAAEAAPAVPSLGAIPLFKDGDQWLAGQAVGGSTFTIDLGISAENPPNPNTASGSDAPEVVASTASMSMTRQKYAKDVFDTMALADAQANNAFFAQWGSTSGGIVQIVVPDARFNYQNPDLGGGIVMESGDLMIDALDRGVAINFPYGAAIA
jgi:hypothetical protein